MLLASFRESSRSDLLFRREAGLSAHPSKGLSALLFSRELHHVHVHRCRCFYPRRRHRRCRGSYPGEPQPSIH